MYYMGYPLTITDATSLFTARPRRPNYLPTSCRAAPAAVAQAPGIELAGVPVGAPPSALAHSDAHCATVPTRTPNSAWSGWHRPGSVTHARAAIACASRRACAMVHYVDHAML